jgi:hypothetical protein
VFIAERRRFVCVFCYCFVVNSIGRYNTTVFLEGGGSQAFASRERPKLLLGADGR